MSSKLTFTSIADDRVGRKKVPGFRLVDNEGGIWEFEVVHINAKRFLSFLKYPSKYKPMIGDRNHVPFFREIEKEVLRAIDNYEITKNLTPKTAQTFKELIDEL